MRSVVLIVAVLTTAVSCKPKKSGPVDSEFGLDERPANPTCVAPERPGTGQAVTFEEAFPNLPDFTIPIQILQKPGDDTKWYVVQQNGIVKVFDNSPTVAAATDYLNIDASVVGPQFATGDERGLLGMAFHPTLDELFVSYSATAAGATLVCNGTTVGASERSIIARIPIDGTGDPTEASMTPVLVQPQPFSNHNGGLIMFGPDEMLYIGFGDGGDAGDTCEAGQNLDTWLGKILRIDIDASATYGVPADNPFVGVAGLDEIWAYGLRNPWRWSFDRETGELWAGDVGQGDWEEISRIEKGGNYGWDDKEGSHCFEDVAPCTGGGRIDPVHEYPHSTGQSVTGGFVYRGTAIPGLVGSYIFADYEIGTIWALSFDPGTGAPVVTEISPPGETISSFGEGNDGEIYVIQYMTGRIMKMVPAGSPPVDTFPDLLSETGCVDAANPRNPAAGLIPYDVNAPLWSDGADKRRWLAIPDGTQITVNADGDWDLPNGSVLMKEFRLGGKRIETRLFVRHSDGGWAGYTYEWNAAETEATLLPAGKTAVVGSQSWAFPSRAECLSCHSEAAGRSLGPETQQLNRDLVYPNNRRANQLATLDHIGMLSGLPASPWPRLPEPDGAQPLEERARAYLHANCSNCHRPGGAGQGQADLLYSTPLAQTNTCDVLPQEGDLGVTGARLLVPGDPALSLVSIRMKRLDSNRMPAIATSVIDPLGTNLIDEWIGSLTACP